MHGQSHYAKAGEHPKHGATPFEVLADDIKVDSLLSIPFNPAPAGFKAVGNPVLVTTGPTRFVDEGSLDLAGVRKHLRETGAKFVAYVKQNALTSSLQAFEPISV